MYTIFTFVTKFQIEMLGVLFVVYLSECIVKQYVIITLEAKKKQNDDY